MKRHSRTVETTTYEHDDEGYVVKETKVTESEWEDHSGNIYTYTTDPGSYTFTTNTWGGSLSAVDDTDDGDEGCSCAR